MVKQATDSADVTDDAEVISEFQFSSGRRNGRPPKETTERAQQFTAALLEADIDRATVAHKVEERFGYSARASRDMVTRVQKMLRSDELDADYHEWFNPLRLRDAIAYQLYQTVSKSEDVPELTSALKALTDAYALSTRTPELHVHAGNVNNVQILSPEMRQAFVQDARLSRLLTHTGSELDAIDAEYETVTSEPEEEVEPGPWVTPEDLDDREEVSDPGDPSLDDWNTWGEN